MKEFLCGILIITTASVLAQHVDPVPQPDMEYLACIEQLESLYQTQLQAGTCGSYSASALMTAITTHLGTCTVASPNDVVHNHLLDPYLKNYEKYLCERKRDQVPISDCLTADLFRAAAALQFPEYICTKTASQITDCFTNTYTLATTPAVTRSKDIATKLLSLCTSASAADDKLCALKLVACYPEGMDYFDDLESFGKCTSYGACRDGVLMAAPCTSAATAVTTDLKSLLDTLAGVYCLSSATQTDCQGIVAECYLNELATILEDDVTSSCIANVEARSYCNSKMLAVTDCAAHVPTAAVREKDSYDDCSITSNLYPTACASPSTFCANGMCQNPPSGATLAYCECNAGFRNRYYAHYPTCDVAEPKKKKNGRRKGDCFKLRLVDRATWGAVAPTGAIDNRKRRQASFVFVGDTGELNCFDQDVCAKVMQDIQDDHKNGYGFKDIGYHFVISGDGTVYEGLPWIQRSEMIEGYAATSLVIGLMGHFQQNKPTKYQMNAFKDLMNCAKRHDYVRPYFTIHGILEIKLGITNDPMAEAFRRLMSLGHYGHNRVLDQYPYPQKPSVT